MKPFKGSFPIAEDFGQPYPASVLKLYPILKKPPWNGKIIGRGYAMPTGTPILSPTPGTVTFAGKDTTGSLTVDYTYSGYRVRMGHLSKIVVKKGQKLGWQTKIGLSGKTGMATHPHLYIQVNKGSKPVNPDVVIKMKKPKPSDPCKKEKETIANLQKERDWFSNRVDTLLKKMSQDEKENKKLMNDMTETLKTKEDRIKELKSLVDVLTADASIGKAVKTALEAIWGFLRRILRRTKDGR